MNEEIRYATRKFPSICCVYFMGQVLSWMTSYCRRSPDHAAAAAALLTCFCPLIAGSYSVASFCLPASVCDAVDGRHYVVNISACNRRTLARPQLEGGDGQRFMELPLLFAALLLHCGCGATALKLTLVPFKVMRFINCKNSFN